MIILKVIKNLRFSSFLKNLLIFIPVLIAGLEIDSFLLIKLIKILTIFFFLTSCCYLVNDYSDRHIDKLNKLKTVETINLKYSLLIFLSVFILFIFTLFYFQQQKNYFIYFYILNFIIYNFFSKQIKFADIFFLTNFYIIRIFCGVEVFNLEIGYGFIIFAYCFFTSFSIIKRLIQIKKNNLRVDNGIIPYSMSDTKMLEKGITYCLFFNILTFLTYIFYNFGLIKLTNHIFAYNFEPNKLLIIFILYLGFLANILKSYYNENINKDIYLFVIKDRFTYLILISIIAIISWS